MPGGVCQECPNCRRPVSRAAGLPAEVIEVAVLLSSELVSDAVRHGSGQPALRVAASAGGLRVEVGDDSEELPVLRVVGPDARYGRGVALVDQCADAWGVVVPNALHRSASGESGKVVWFELRVALMPPRGEPLLLCPSGR